MTRRVAPVSVRGTTIGGGVPVVIVPIMGSDLSEVLLAARGLAGHAVDLVEWRIDHLAAVSEAGNRSEAAVIDEVLEVARGLRRELDTLRPGGLPLLATVRTAAEGGRAALDDDRYARLLDALTGARAADLLDVEPLRSPADAEGAIVRAHAAGMPVIASSHDFGGTPCEQDILQRFLALQESGADVAKVAVMPHEPDDVVRLLHATWTMRSAHARVPLIAVSMGRLGLVSRLAGGAFGSAATFASIGRASAPGQIDSDRVRSVLEMLDSPWTSGSSGTMGA